MVYPIGRMTVLPIYELWLRKVEGSENIPGQKPFIVASNHASLYDGILLYCVLIPKINKNIHALVNSAYWDAFITRAIVKWGKAIPVFVGEEKNSKKNKESFEKAINYLKKGEIIAIFPEGKRSPDGKLQKAYTGMAKLALKAKVPVLPVGIIDSHKVLPKGKSFPRLKRCEVKIGKPMEFKNKKYNEKTFEEVTRSIMKEIAKLISQKYNY